MELGSGIPASNAPGRTGRRRATARSEDTALKADPPSKLAGDAEAVLLKGPTCVGKTRLVVELAKLLPLRVISVDSACVYRDLDIGTAKPGPEERRIAPHYLVDLCSPHERYSAARFAEDARREIARARELGQVPVLVGGTMLYFRALEQGLADLPGPDAALRTAIRERAGREGWPALHEQLKQLDPAAAARISPNDRARIERALEVLRLTGRPISELWLDASAAVPPRYLKFALIPEDRSAWRRRIEERFDDMMNRDWLDQARALHALKLDPGLPAPRIAGYRQLLEHLDGQFSLDEARVRGIRATKALGRRQLTWLRAEEGIIRLVPENSRCVAQVENEIRSHWRIRERRATPREDHK